MSACEVSRQVCAQQSGIATSYKHVDALSEKAIHKQRPPFHILYFVEKQMLKPVIYAIQSLQYQVKMLCAAVGKALIVEIDVSIIDTCFL